MGVQPWPAPEETRLDPVIPAGTSETSEQDRNFYRSLARRTEASMVSQQSRSKLSSFYQVASGAAVLLLFWSVLRIFF